MIGIWQRFHRNFKLSVRINRARPVAWTDTQTDGQTDRQMDRHTDRQTDTHTDTQTHRLDWNYYLSVYAEGNKHIPRISFLQ